MPSASFGASSGDGFSRGVVALARGGVKDGYGRSSDRRVTRDASTAELIVRSARNVRGSGTRSVILALLTALNLLNYLDRYVLSAVLTPIQDDLHLSNFVAGLLADRLPYRLLR